MQKIIATSVLLVFGLAAADAADAAGDAEKGKQHYAVCAACHGQNGEGSKLLNAPANAGQDLWYMIRQLKNFRAGIRGAHEGDTFGAQMRPMALALPDDQAVADVAAYIATFDLPQPEKTVEGDVEAGKKAYTTCVPCHGEYGEGAKALDAPRIANQHDWYVVRQLQNFIAGVRGTHPNDVYGAQMRIMSQMLETEERIRDVAAYIATLEYREARD